MHWFTVRRNASWDIGEDWTNFGGGGANMAVRSKRFWHIIIVSFDQ